MAGECVFCTLDNNGVIVNIGLATSTDDNIWVALDGAGDIGKGHKVARGRYRSSERHDGSDVKPEKLENGLECV